MTESVISIDSIKTDWPQLFDSNWGASEFWHWAVASLLGSFPLWGLIQKLMHKCHIFFFFFFFCSSIREWIDFWWCTGMMFATLRMRKFMRSVQYCTITDFCWGGHEVLVNSKLYIDRREAEVSLNCLCSITFHVHWNKSQQLLYKRLKGLSFRSHNAKFRFESYLVANSQRHVF